MRYVAPTSIEEAVSVLVADESAQVYAGATDFIPQLRMGRPEPDLAVDVKRIDRLVGLRQEEDRWVIGAATPSVRLGEEAALVAELPGLVESANLIGSDQIQSRASLGGNLCNASPAADSVPAMVVNNGRAVIAGPDGMRTIPVSSVVISPGRTSLGRGEFLVELEFDRPPPRTSDAYLRFIPRTEMDIAVVGVGVRLSLDEAGLCEDVSVALGAVAPTVVSVPSAGEILIGNALSEDALSQVAEEASAACNPIDDKRGTKAYRRQVAGVLTVRALKTAAARIGSQPR
ncbi:MAG: xanthine dehydrogenase family protein subunit M [Acidimicrobiia bacterium]|nr:xanthine dehydrogenase family protein subunit M [Acidimicrobiia bacterium]